MNPDITIATSRMLMLAGLRGILGAKKRRAQILKRRQLRRKILL